VLAHGTTHTHTRRAKVESCVRALAVPYRGLVLITPREEDKRSRVELKNAIFEEAQVCRSPHQAVGEHDQVPRSCRFIARSPIKNAATDLANA
jgi:hypothetical protein